MNMLLKLKSCVFPQKRLVEAASAEPQRPLVDRRRRGDAFSHSHFFCKLLSMFVVCELITFA